ncbi:MAG TPA: NUDIX hydrolase [Xanthobacteraceae bacterium]|nr:NUDIX hydrolase [Xanthobacteraceae bacterium]
MRKPAKAASAARIQYAALPFRARERSGLEVLLVTSRVTKRWIIPKGWPLKRKPPHVTAAHEAHEEAGVIGKIGKSPIGSYSYTKRLKTGSRVRCEVHVFPLEVQRQSRTWPEQNEREVQWLSPAEAAKSIENPILRTLVRHFRHR